MGKVFILWLQMHLQGKLTDVRNKANAQQGNNKKKKKKSS
ncbi:hypothetical protein QG37_04046 [Candidozyma auris]|uniref:Uncharacterized protein n=1 Tax=Candidozyma auris TaxID=498019 RepID=A0A0L0NXR5_CANAR|nr:hypothetical protein QG37_04046 [[Candida] auris]